jgi:hypothetical protein
MLVLMFADAGHAKIFLIARQAHRINGSAMFFMRFIWTGTLR